MQTGVCADNARHPPRNGMAPAGACSLPARLPAACPVRRSWLRHEHHGFAHPVQKATAGLLLQRLHRVADRGLGKMQLLRRGGEAGGAGEDGESAELSAIKRLRHG